MVWACFSGDHLGPLLTLEKGGIGYMDILYEWLTPMLDDLMNLCDDLLDDEKPVTADKNIPYVFMHDNAPCHTTPEVTELLQEEGIQVMKWPAYSPDLNPIENLWFDLKNRFYKEWVKLHKTPSQSKNAYDVYADIIQRVWYWTNFDFIRVLVESMPRHVEAVIAAQGSHTKY